MEGHYSNAEGRKLDTFNRDWKSHWDHRKISYARTYSPSIDFVESFGAKAIFRHMMNDDNRSCPDSV